MISGKGITGPVRNTPGPAKEIRMDHLTAWLHASGWNRDLDGYVASALVLVTFSMRSMRALRVVAIASNVAFIFYALVADLHPILVLHATLLPLNIVRLAQTELAATNKPTPNAPA